MLAPIAFISKYRYELFALLFLFLMFYQVKYDNLIMATLDGGLVIAAVLIANSRNWKPRP